MLFLLVEAVDDNGGSYLLICLTALTMLYLEDDLNKLSPSNLYPPVGFYPMGSEDEFWLEHQDLFFFKFRFRLEHFHQMIRAMDFADKFSNAVLNASSLG